MKRLLTFAGLTADSHAIIPATQWYQKSLTFSSAWRISILICLTILAYFPVFTHRFLYNWDDQWVVQNAYTDSGLSFYNLLDVLTEYYNGQYAPVNETYYILLHAIAGYNPFLFHTGSLLIHIANVLLVYSLFKQLLTQAGTFNETSVNRIAFISALLLAIHPFLVESVAWLSASKIIIYVFFYLLALKSYLSFISTHKRKWYLLTLVFFILSFGGKEQAVTLPLVLLLIDFTLQRNLKSKQVWLEKIPFIILTLAGGIITILSQADNGQGLLGAGKDYPFYQKIIFASYCLTEYLIKCILPVNLMYIYPFPNAIGDPVPLRFWLYPFALVAAAFLLFSFWKQRWIFFGICFFVIHLSTVLHIIPISRFAIIADRYVYLSAVGVVFMIAYLYDRLITEQKVRTGILFTGMLFYCLCLGVYTHARSKVWHNGATLKKEVHDIVKERPDYKTRLKHRK